MSRLRIGTSLNPAEAALMRSMLSAHGIDAVVRPELAGLSGALANDLWVDEADREEAAALLGQLRRQVAEVGDAELDDDDDDTDARAAFQQRIDRRRRTGVALLLGCFLTFGTAHLFMRAWLLGIALAALETIGFVRLYAGDPSGRIIVIAAIAADLLGALVRIWRAPRAELPVARIVD